MYPAVPEVHHGRGGSQRLVAKKLRASDNLKRIMAISRQRYRYNAAGAGTYTLYADLWYNTSAQERKLHRQFQACNVRGGLLKDSNQDAVAEFNVAPHTWVTKTALRRGKRLFDKMNAQVLKENELVMKPKYHDFKVYLNDNMRTATILYPQDAEGSNIPRNEWVYAQFHSEDVNWADPNLLTNSNRQADTFTAHIVGEHVGSATDWTSVSLMESWFRSRPEPHADNPLVNSNVISDPLTNLFDEADADDEIMESLRNNNDRAPYDEFAHFGYVPGAGNNAERGLQRVAFAATQSGAGQISAINGFTALCGLVEIVITVNGPGVVEILLDVDTKGEKI